MRRLIPRRAHSFTGVALDRAAHLRNDPAALDAMRRDPLTRFVLFRNGRPLVESTPPRAVLSAPPADDAPWLLLGRIEGRAVFAADLSDQAAEPATGDFLELHALFGLLPAADAALLLAAKGLLHWRAHNRFCAFCGGRNRPDKGGHVLLCEACGTEHFPRSDPAVIMLVTRGEKCLLGQSLRFPRDRNWYSALAGFVEPGESLEEAVRREVFEEVGVRVGEVAYHSSQPWPFPTSLMLGYHAEGLNDEIVLQTDEMRDAHWFTRAEIEGREALGFDLPPPESIARQLIEDWLAL